MNLQLPSLTKDFLYSAVQKAIELHYGGNLGLHIKHTCREQECFICLSFGLTISMQIYILRLTVFAMPGCRMTRGQLYLSTVWPVI